MSSTDMATGIVSLRGKRVLVTQASEFMGPMLCSVLAEAGADVVADDSSLIDPGTPAAIVDKAGRVDVLVANLAFAAPTTRARDVADEEWQAVFRHLVDPLPRLVRAVLPQMIERRSGKILLIGSAAALRGMKRASTYSAARGAQLAYVQAVGVEVGAAQCPGQCHRAEFRREPDVFSTGGAGAAGISGSPAARSAVGTPGGGEGRRAVRRVPVQQRCRLFRRPGVSGVRRLGDAVRALSPDAA